MNEYDFLNSTKINFFQNSRFHHSLQVFAILLNRSDFKSVLPNFALHKLSNNNKKNETKFPQTKEFQATQVTIL